MPNGAGQQELLTEKREKPTAMLLKNMLLISFKYFIGVKNIIIVL